MQQEERPGKPEESSHALKVLHGRWVSGTAAAAAFAALLVLVGLRRETYLGQLAVVLLAAAVPLCGQYVMAAAAPSGTYRGSNAMRFFAAVGLFLSPVGIAIMLWDLFPTAGLVWTFFSVTLACVLADAEVRARRHAKKPAADQA